MYTPLSGVGLIPNSRKERPGFLMGNINMDHKTDKKHKAPQDMENKQPGFVSICENKKGTKPHNEIRAVHFFYDFRFTPMNALMKYMLLSKCLNLHRHLAYILYICMYSTFRHMRQTAIPLFWPTFLADAVTTCGKKCSKRKKKYFFPTCLVSSCIWFHMLATITQPMA